MSDPVEDLNLVSNLIDHDDKEWRQELIIEHFCENDVKRILAVPSSWRNQNDDLTWAFTNEGIYSVKTAYMLGQGINLKAVHEACLLKHRHPIEDATCPRCHQIYESARHSIFECTKVIDLCEKCGCAEMSNWERVKPGCDLVASWKNFHPKKQQYGATLAWCIWTERNQRVFENKSTSNDIIGARVKRLVEEYGNYNTHIYKQPTKNGKQSSSKWDFTGSVIFAATKRIRAYWSPEVAEAKAIDIAVRLGRKYGLEEVILESDCKNLVNRPSKGVTYLSDLDYVLDDILVTSTSFKSISWSHVKRDANSVAHHLGRLFPFGSQQVWENHYPTEIVPYVNMDILSLDQ
ncbi:uncharacterized protein LOC141715208 [Apium graveolens]|uniref:uncharacterized protein LOC141715208 n=1 Tax=Apium graveolens TaxID=4045 RepID=UPI003D7C0125